VLGVEGCIAGVTGCSAGDERMQCWGVLCGAGRIVSIICLHKTSFACSAIDENGFVSNKV
jgi:hypothetical protein